MPAIILGNKTKLNKEALSQVYFLRKEKQKKKKRNTKLTILLVPSRGTGKVLSRKENYKDEVKVISVVLVRKKTQVNR